MYYYEDGYEVGKDGNADSLRIRRMDKGKNEEVNYHEVCETRAECIEFFNESV